MADTAGALAVLADAAGWREVTMAVLGADEIWSNLVSLTQIAERRGTNPGTVGTWIERYADFPKPVPVPDGWSARWWWPDLLPYLEAKQLPKYHRKSRFAEASDIPIGQVDAATWTDPAARAAAVNYWLDGTSVNTLQIYRGHISEWFAWCDRRGVHPGHPERKDVSTWRGVLNRQRIGPSQVGRKLAAVSSFYLFWADRGVVPHDPAAPAGRARHRVGGDSTT